MSLLLPQGSRLVHVGPHKTGSTAIQSALHAARPVLAEHGVYYPTGGWRRRRAGWALGLPGRPKGTELPPISEWDQLVAEVAEAPATRVCVSNEDFGRADDETARKIVEDLGGDDVHVVAVARRLDRYLPSQWQERVKAGHPRSYEQWLRGVLDDSQADARDSRFEYRNVWQAHDLAALATRWTRWVGPDRFTLVVSDDSDLMMIPRVFEEMLGLPDETLRPDPQANQSLSWSEVEMLREINHAFRRNGWGIPERTAFLKRGLIPALKGRGTRAPGPRRPPMPDWALADLQERSERRIKELSALPIRILGDLERLRVPAADAGEETAIEDLTVPVDLAAFAVEAAIAAGLKLPRQ